MPTLLSRIKHDYPRLKFKKSESFYWSPRKNTVHYRQSPKTEEASWPLLHEVGHALLSHQKFQSDFELLLLEIEAWERAKKLAGEYGIKINKDHIEDCLDTYRDWLYRRSTCPNCMASGLQVSSDTYSCINCNNIWHVSASRKCRTYRMSAK